MDRNPDGLKDEDFEEAIWKSQVMIQISRKAGYGKGWDSNGFWTNMISFAKDRRLTQAQLDRIRDAHKYRHNQKYHH